MLIWREILWKPLKVKLTHACSDFIKLYRSNPNVEIQLIDDLIKSYGKIDYCLSTSFSFFDILEALEFPKDMFISIDDQEIKVAQENIYENYFEKQFLQDTEVFYQSKTALDFEHGSIPEYLKMV